jgi:hypothetical protein
MRRDIEFLDADLREIVEAAVDAVLIIYAERS